MRGPRGERGAGKEGETVTFYFLWRRLLLVPRWSWELTDIFFFSLLCSQPSFPLLAPLLLTGESLVCASIIDFDRLVGGGVDGNLEERARAGCGVADCSSVPFFFFFFLLPPRCFVFFSPPCPSFISRFSTHAPAQFAGTFICLAARKKGRTENGKERVSLILEERGKKKNSGS